MLSEENSVTAEPLPVDSPEESIPRAVVPWNKDDNKSRYLGLRASGFTIREALALIGDAKSTLSKWRKDSVFLDLENRIPELRKTLALEYAGLEFLRNYRLVLEKDFRVLKESLNKKTHTVEIQGKPVEVPVGMTAQDFQYLVKMRGHYTPQQLQAIEQLFGRDNGDGPEANWTDFFLAVKETVVREVKVGTRQRSESNLGKIVEGSVIGETKDND